MTAASAERFPYELVSHWRADGTIEDAFAILTDAPGLPRWWPQAYTSVAETAPGDPLTGIGRTYAIVTRGVLPYNVNWQLTLIEAEPPLRLRVAAAGDLFGYGEWRLRQDGAEAALSYEWRVRLGKPWMRRIEWLMKPLFVLNHNWVMRKGEAGFRREMAQRREGPPEV